MFQRQFYKQLGKAAFKANYWRCVLVGFILLFVGGSVTAPNWRINMNTNSFNPGQYSSYSEFSELDELPYVGSDPEIGEMFEDMVNDLRDADWSKLGIILGIGLAVFLVIFVIAIVFRALILNPLQVGCINFFVQNADMPAQFGEVGIGFQASRWGRVAGTMFLRNLYVFLWSLLLVIPGIIKAYEYYFVPYLLASHPEMSREDVFAASKCLTDGHKWDIFVMELSFLGWQLLSILTLGLLNIFYVTPYLQASMAAMYRCIAAEHGL